MIDCAVLSYRSKDFKLFIQTENGELVEQDAPAVSTIRGTLRGVVGSKVIGCVEEDGCCVEPVGQTIENPVFAGVHVVYSQDDVMESDRQCGTVTNLVDAAVEAEIYGVQAVAKTVATADHNLHVTTLVETSDGASLGHCWGTSTLTGKSMS